MIEFNIILFIPSKGPLDKNILILNGRIIATSIPGNSKICLVMAKFPLILDLFFIYILIPKVYIYIEII